MISFIQFSVKQVKICIQITDIHNYYSDLSMRHDVYRSLNKVTNWDTLH